MARKPRVSKQTNGIDTDVAKAFIGRVESLEADIASERGSYMAKAKAVREDIKEVILEAKDAGIPRAALKAMLADRKLDRKKAELVAGLDIDESAAFEQMREAVGDLPIFKAAIDAHKKRDAEEFDEEERREQNEREQAAGGAYLAETVAH